MTPTDLAILKTLVDRHEGNQLKVYLDSLGIPTIGRGRNLRDKGITPSESDLLLENDIADVSGALLHLFPWFASLDVPRQIALIDMAFMGPEKLLGFTHMTEALRTGDFQTAAMEAMRSKWAAQVGKRAEDIATIFRTGTVA